VTVYETCDSGLNQRGRGWERERGRERGNHTWTAVARTVTVLALTMLTALGSTDATTAIASLKLDSCPALKEDTPASCGMSMALERIADCWVGVYGAGHDDQLGSVGTVTTDATTWEEPAALASSKQKGFGRLLILSLVTYTVPVGQVFWH